MLKQKEAVFNTVLSVLAKSGRTYSETTPVELSKEERATVVEIVTNGVLAGQVALKEKAASKYSTKEALNTYVSGMVKNWLSKDTRLNGGVPHKTKNPGSRATSGDAVIDNLKALLKTVTKESERAEIAASIAERKSQLKTPKVDVTQIPESLRKSLNV